MAQLEVKFVHNDLHVENILIKRCDPELVIRYKISNSLIFDIPTYGYYPIIIDYGYAYIQNLDLHPFYSTTSIVNFGYMPFHFNPLNDLHVFLIGSQHEIISTRLKNDKETEKYRYLTKKLFRSNYIDAESGWVLLSEQSPLSIVRNFLNGNNTFSKIVDNLHYDYDISLEDYFAEYNTKYRFNEMISLCQSLVILPFSQENSHGLFSSCKLFFQLYFKFEAEISKKQKIREKFLFKKFLDEIRFIRFSFINQNEQQKAINHFKSVFNIFKMTDEQLINMISSLLMFAVKFENALKTQIDESIDDLKIIYQNFESTDSTQIVTIFDKKYPLPLPKKHKILVIDNVLKKKYMLEK